MISVKPEIFLLIFIRVCAAVMFLPLVGSVARRAWLAIFCAAVSWVVYPIAQARLVDSIPTSMEQLMFLACEQLVVGLLVGFWVRISLAAFEISGQLVGFQMGFAVANVFDPMSSLEASVIAHIEELLAALIFFATNLHHTLLEGLLLGIGPKPWILGHPNAMLNLVLMAGSMFEAALKISAPVIASLFLSKIALSILARAVPQINAFMFGFPITIGLGLIMLSFTLPQIATNARGFLGYAMKIAHAIGR